MSDHVLYRMFNTADELLYVGVTLRPVARLRDHSKDKDWWSEVATIRLQSFPNRTLLLEAERAAIVSERPRFNVVLNGLPRRRWYSIEEVAESMCGDTKWPSVKWLHRQIKSGKLPATKRKGAWYCTDADIEAFIDACSNKPRESGYVLVEYSAPERESSLEDGGLNAAAIGEMLSGGAP